MPPHWSGLGEQAAICCTERVWAVPDAMAAKDSIVSAVACAQHEPQEPWFFTGEITPFVRQSTEAGSSLSESLVEFEFCFF